MRYRVEFELESPCEPYEISEWNWMRLLESVSTLGDRVDFTTIKVYKQAWRKI